MTGKLVVVTDFLDEKRREIQARLKELKPLVDEYTRLEAAEQALAGLNGSSASGRAAAAPHTARRTRGAAKASGTGTGTGTGRRGRPKGSGQRAQQALELVRNRPGITVPELAEAMGIKQNYLYRVMPDLAEQGLVTKSGRGWHIRQ
jgi:CRP-like cAMP-binding protein